jgi:hypothetical protein
MSLLTKKERTMRRGLLIAVALLGFGCGSPEESPEEPAVLRTCLEAGYDDICSGASPVCIMDEHQLGVRMAYCECADVSYFGREFHGNSCGTWLVMLPELTCFVEQDSCPE